MFSFNATFCHHKRYSYEVLWILSERLDGYRRLVDKPDKLVLHQSKVRAQYRENSLSVICARKRDIERQHSRCVNNKMYGNVRMDMDQDYRSGLRAGDYRDALIVASEDWLVREAVSRVLGAAFPGVTVDSLPTTPPPGPGGLPIVCGIRLLSDAPASAAAGFASGNPWTVLLADASSPAAGAAAASAEGGILTDWRTRPDLIIAAVGEQLRTRQVSRSGGVTGGRRNPALRLLTRRQLEVVRLIAQGKPNAEIASMLGMSENTVRIHVSAILKTLGLANRTQAALWATQNVMSDPAV